MIANAPEYAFLSADPGSHKEEQDLLNNPDESTEIEEAVEKPFGGAISNPDEAAMYPLGHFSVLTAKAECSQCRDTLASTKQCLKKLLNRYANALPEKMAEAKKVHDAFKSDRNDSLPAIDILAKFGLYRCVPFALTLDDIVRPSCLTYSSGTTSPALNTLSYPVTLTGSLARCGHQARHAMPVAGRLLLEAILGFKCVVPVAAVWRPEVMLTYHRVYDKESSGQKWWALFADSRIEQELSS